MFMPAAHTEIDTIAGYLEAQLDAVRLSAFGLTEEQAKTRPCRSAFSVGGVLKHVSYVCRGRRVRVEADGETETPQQMYARMEEFTSSFTLTEDETLAGALEEFDAAAADLLELVRDTDPGGATVEPPAPWFGINEPTPSNHRFNLVHLIEEVARHAGHADIIREQLDGATAGELYLAAHNIPGNDFMQPWSPAKS